MSTSQVSISVERSYTLLRFEVVKNEHIASLRDMATLFQAMTDEWVSAYLWVLNEKGIDQATFETREFRARRSSQRIEIPSLIPAKLIYASPLQIVFEHWVLMGGVSSVGSSLLLMNRFLDGVVRIAGFRSELKASRHRKSADAKRAQLEDIEAENELQERLDKLGDPPQMEPDQWKRRKQVKETGFALVFMGQVRQEVQPPPDEG